MEHFHGDPEMHYSQASVLYAPSIGEGDSRLARARNWLVHHLLTVPAQFLARRALRKAERHLLSLDDHLLRDIGLDRTEIEATLGYLPRQRRNGAALLGPVYGSLDPFR
jgi:uncharacterized protein YjiS (DUF1127 family)